MLRRAAAREGSRDNYLRLKSFFTFKSTGLKVNLTHLSWEPMVEINACQFFKGYTEGRRYENFWPEMRKLKDWLPYDKFEDPLPRHCDEFISALPFQELSDPKLELDRWDSITKLHCDMSDAVALSEEQQTAIQQLKRKYLARDEKERLEQEKLDHHPIEQLGDCTGSWKEMDVSKIIETEKHHSQISEQLELSHNQPRRATLPGLPSVVHPIHDQCFYLTSEHKRSWRRNFGVEPWTFEQRVGEVVFIPAGCPHQVRNLKEYYPISSGSGLHVGHPLGYTATDILTRFKRMQGCNVLHPMGWDAFGLPAEQYAIELKSLGFSYDWDREISTAEPEYYKWTGWIFLQLLKRGLAYQAELPVNLCPALGTVLANGEVVDGVSERGGHPVIINVWHCVSLFITKQPMRQWMLKITAYADCLLEDLVALDWPESVKEMQRNWIGRSEGAEMDFHVLDEDGNAAMGRRAIMAVPAHDTCDYDFATKYHIPIRWVVKLDDEGELQVKGLAFCMAVLLGVGGTYPSRFLGGYRLKLLIFHLENLPEEEQHCATMDWFLLYRYRSPVDIYVDGAEHAVLHLLYSRFWHKVLYDIGVLSAKEPFKCVINQGIILGEVQYIACKDPDGNYMSADSANMLGEHQEIIPEEKVTEEIEGTRFNTGISAMMEFIHTACHSNSFAYEPFPECFEFYVIAL
ncbi:hypothetical protein GH714_000445 [Hevea brasiliensis]|uniref:leucine--tRNA ligase n=1 Tax=Hevea brasiliensis TaxID=3981 RepID=A0A6A6LXE8_HEVBR|nr:hypothetical protein GH714_000445 [Hevea brasiliensis]